MRLLHELNERGTIAAVADALQFTPSAVSQQLSVLEREAGVQLLEPAGRGVRLTDPALVLAEHARELLDRAELAEAELAAAAGGVAGRARIAGFQSVSQRVAIPAMRVLAREAPSLRCELVEAEPEQSISCSRTSGRSSPTRDRMAWTATTCTAIPSASCSPRTTPRPAATRAPSRWPSSPGSAGPPAIRGRDGRR